MSALGVSERPLVLVVEDDPDVAEVLSGLLARFGFEVRSEHDGAKAITALRAGYRPRVMVLDLMMPNMDGFRFRAAQQEDPDLAAIPTIVITANSKATAETLGVDVCLRKPFEVETLIAAIQSQIARPQ